MKTFALGRMVATRGVNDRVAAEEDFAKFVWNSLLRYRKNDWGDLDKEDSELNDRSIGEGGRIFAAYIFEKDQTKIWIITEWDRSATTILFPEEY